MELSIYFDFVGVLQAAITEASLPDPEPLLGAVKKLDMDATNLFSVLRAFFPTMRNTVWAVKADLTSAKKRISQIRRDYSRSWFYSSRSSLDPRAIDEIEKVMVHLFGTIERKMVHVRVEAEVSVTSLAEVKKDLEQVDKSLKQNKDLSEQVKADKSEIFLGRWRFKGELLTVENSLRIMDSINVMVAGVKNTVAELNSLINQAVGEVKGFMVLTGQPVHLPFGEASLDTLFDSIDMAIECLDQSITAPQALGRGSLKHKLLDR
ncbi:hypothetical protein F4825DRAFT_473333 [Nemania diffusa]|nr:hypothetical protein F4825DRAFT_473333 [Nemania diffusa]